MDELLARVAHELEFGDKASGFYPVEEVRATNDAIMAWRKTANP